MTKRGPYTRKNLSFVSSIGPLFLEEKDTLYIALVELGFRDDMKAHILAFMANLGLLRVDVDSYVHLNAPPEARSLAFTNQFPLAAKLISAHDNILSFRRLRKCRETRDAAARKATAKRCKISESIVLGSNFFPNDGYDDQSVLQVANLLHDMKRMVAIEGKDEYHGAGDDSNNDGQYKGDDNGGGGKRGGEKRRNGDGNGGEGEDCKMKRSVRKV
jgi:hypothetical protein